MRCHGVLRRHAGPHERQHGLRDRVVRDRDRRPALARLGHQMLDGLRCSTGGGDYSSRASGAMAAPTGRQQRCRHAAGRRCLWRRLPCLALRRRYLCTAQTRSPLRLQKPPRGIASDKDMLRRRELHVALDKAAHYQSTSLPVRRWRCRQTLVEEVRDRVGSVPGETLR